MRKQSLQLDWQVAKDEREWERLHKPSTSDETSSIQHHQPGQRLPEIITVVIVLVAGIVGWWWQLETNEPQPGQTAARELNSTNDEAHHQSSTNHWQLDEATLLALHAAIQNEFPLYTNRMPQVAAEIINLQGDQAVVQVIKMTEVGKPLSRQTRFYQQTKTGWVRTAPDARLWGDERRLETPSFIFHLRENDIQDVLAITTQTEKLHTSLRQTLGLPPTYSGPKLVIEIRVTEPPGRVSHWSFPSYPIVVPSPALYQAPVELTNEGLLLQSIALPLAYRLLLQMRTEMELTPRWEPLFGGLNLWLLWEQELPLAAWQEPVIEWIYADVPAVGARAGVILPALYTELCAVHGLWLSSPAQIGIPLMCDPAGEARFRNLWGARDPLVRLNQFNFPGDFDSYIYGYIEPIQRPDQTVAVVTLIDYMVTTYGREQLPVLLASLKTADSWETLIADVYGISVAEFESGWQVYLDAYSDSGR